MKSTKVKPRWSIRRKLSLVTTGVTLFALALLGTITIAYEWRGSRDTLSRELSIQADIIGANSVVALSFEAVNGTTGKRTLVTDFDASDTLETLRANRHIVLACIYSKAKKVLASYTPKSEGAGVCPMSPPATGSVFSDTHLTVTRPIIEPDGETVGTVYLKSDLDELYAGIKDHAMIITGVALAGLLLAFLLSVWLQNRISSPVLSLASTAARVSEQRDYSLRAEGQSQDEVGLLVTAFNDMLGRIQKRDSELQVLTGRLEEYSSSLEEKVDQRTAELASAMEEARGARDRAVQASQAKSQFLANMSHEIRTPLNAIIGLTNLGLRAKPKPKIARYLTKVSSSSRSLLAIINDILDFSKIEAHKLDLVTSDFDLCTVMGHLTDVIGEPASERGLEFLVSIGADVPCALRGDALRLEQVLTNLAGNAVKFTEQGTVLVKVVLVEKSDSRCTIDFTVKDTGIGIDKELIPRLFDSFAQADDSTTRKYGGTGLGLSISQRLVRLMGSEIRVDSEEGKGSTFSFTLDLDRQSTDKDKWPQPSKDLVGTRALVVDDNEYAREVLTDMLETLSFKPEAVQSGHEGIEELARASEAQSPYQLVLLDWKMPEMDGIETARRMERDARIEPVMPKVLMVTAYGREEVIKQAEDAGFDGFLVKPVSHSALFDAIMEAFGREGTVVRERQVNKREVEAARLVAGARVLLAEDVEVNQEIVRETLEDVGVSLEVVADGEQALRLLDDPTPFDAVLMDVQMPVMDGYQATRAIRADPRHADLPIIALTAHATTRHRELCLKAGMNDHVAKPIDTVVLLSALARWVGSAPRRSGQAFKPSRRSSDAGEQAGVLPEQLAGITLEVALKRVAGNRRLLRRLLISFATKYGESANEIRQALNSGDCGGAEQLAHAVKGVAGNVGAEALFSRAAEVEEAIQNSDNADAVLEAFDKALSEVVQAINSLPADSSAAEPDASPPDTSAEPLGPRLAQLLEQLASNHIDAQRNFASLKQQLMAHVDAVELARIEKQIHQLDFKSAHEAVQLVASRLG